MLVFAAYFISTTFPVQLFPRGKKTPPLEFDGTRTASSIFYWASRGVPSTISRTQTAKGVAEIVANVCSPRLCLQLSNDILPELGQAKSCADE